MNTKQRRIWKLPRGTKNYWVSKDFDHVACIGSCQGTRFLTYDDHRETGFDFAELSGNRQCDFVEAILVNRADKQYYVVLGRALPAFDEVKDIVVSIDGAQIAFAGRSGNHWHWVLNGRIVASGKSVSKRTTFFFSPDGMRWVCSICRDDGWYVMVDGAGYGPFDSVQYEEPDLYTGHCIQPGFSQDSRQALFAVRKRDRWLLFCEGLWHDFHSRRSTRNLDEFELNSSAAIDDRTDLTVTWTHSLAGSRWAAAYEVEGKWSRLMVDGNFLPQDFDWLRLNSCAIPNKFSTGNDAFFSPGGRHYACPVMLGDASCILFDGDLIPCAANDLKVRNIFWHPNGERYDFLATLRDRSLARDENGLVAGDVCMVLGGKAGPAFWDLDGGLYYSPDGLHTAYVGMAMTGEKEARDHMMVDGVSVYKCGFINHHDTVGFTADNKLYFISATPEDNTKICCDYFFHYGDSVSEAHYSFFDCLVSPDNLHIAIFGQRERMKRRRQDILILDGKRRLTAATGWSHHCFSPDSRHHLWEVERKGQEWLLLDGKILFGLSQCNWWARFTSDSRYIEYVSQHGRTLRNRKVSVAKLLKRRQRIGRGKPGKR